jgi:hypothetical protein
MCFQFYFNKIWDDLTTAPWDSWPDNGFILQSLIVI